MLIAGLEVKGTTLGLAVLAMIVFMLLDGLTVPVAQIVVFAIFSSLGTVLVARFLASVGQPTVADKQRKNRDGVGN